MLLVAFSSLHFGLRRYTTADVYNETKKQLSCVKSALFWRRKSSKGNQLHSRIFSNSRVPCWFFKSHAEPRIRLQRWEEGLMQASAPHPVRIEIVFAHSPRAHQFKPPRTHLVDAVVAVRREVEATRGWRGDNTQFHSSEWHD